jgi:hypothetical protein
MGILLGRGGGVGVGVRDTTLGEGGKVCSSSWEEVFDWLAVSMN